MKVNVEIEWTVGYLIDLQRKNILQVNHEYQRGLRWTDMQKRMFIDSIFRGYSIPAFYFHKNQTSAGPITNTYYDVVDGQQRINAIYSYSEGAFSLINPSDDSGFRFPISVKNSPCPWGGKRFDELSDELQRKLKEHKVTVYELVTNEENHIRDLFIRLQGGTPLTPQDKRDSWPGNFTEYVLKIGGKSGVEKWPGVPLFKEILKPVNESRRRQLVAQVFILFWTLRNKKKFCDIKSSTIDEFYHAQVGFDDQSHDAKKFNKICRKLDDALHGRPRVFGHYIIHLVLFADSLLEEYAQGWEPHLASKLNEFDKRRRKAAEAEKNGEKTEYRRYYTEYGQLTQTQSDIANTIRRRHALFSEEMLKLLSPTKLDPKRDFSEFERQTVFFRDLELCQWCRMNGEHRRVSWDECDIHHVTPHSKGGVTEISNAALVHRDCHPKNEVDVDDFRNWWRHRATTPPEKPSPETPNPRSNSLPPDGTRVKFEFDGQVHFGVVQERKLHLSSGAIICDSFSRASGEISGTSRNGWRDWHLKLPGESNWILADEWRNMG